MNQKKESSYYLRPTQIGKHVYEIRFTHDNPPMGALPRSEYDKRLPKLLIDGQVTRHLDESGFTGSLADAIRVKDLSAIVSWEPKKMTAAEFLDQTIEAPTASTVPPSASPADHGRA